LPIYQFTARDDTGQLITDRLAFRDELELRNHLHRNNLFLLDVAERRQLGLRMKRGIRLGDLIIMSRQLKTMVKAGMPLVSALEALSEQSTNPILGEVIKDIQRSVSVGRTLASSLGDFPKIFPEMLVTLVQSGETSGRLPEALDEASRQLEQQMEIRQKLISAFMYPGFLLLTTIGVLTVMMVWIVPVFASIYKDLHATLPPPTLLLVWLSDLIIHETWIPLLILIAAAISINRYYKTPEGLMNIDRIKLRLPVVGNLVRKTGAANITGSLAGLLESGVPLIQGLETCARVCGNAVMAHAVRKAASNIQTGKRLSDELELTEQFQLMVVRMIAMAEETASLPEVLRQISADYIQEVEYAIKRFMAVIEPIMILVLGAVVGFVLVALYYPIFNLGNVFLKGA